MRACGLTSRERDLLREQVEKLQHQAAGVELKEKMSKEDLDKLTKEVSCHPVDGVVCI